MGGIGHGDGRGHRDGGKDDEGSVLHGIVGVGVGSGSVHNSDHMDYDYSAGMGHAGHTGRDGGSMCHATRDLYTRDLYPL